MRNASRKNLRQKGFKKNDVVVRRSASGVAGKHWPEFWKPELGGPHTNQKKIPVRKEKFKKPCRRRN